MAKIDLALVSRSLSIPGVLDAAIRIDPPEHPHGALHLSVDGTHCATSICVWPSGAGEASWSPISGPTVIREFQVTESSVVDALLTLAREAAVRASGTVSNNACKVAPDGTPQLGR